LAATLAGTPFPLYGDGSAVRDFTFVDDVVLANLAAADHDCAPGTVVNIAGGSSITMTNLLALVAEVTGHAPLIDRQGPQPGDVARTGGTVERARVLLDWKPTIDLRTGLAAQADWHRARRS
jgi:nucleoside-diphosphate-sugar epimerase